MKDEIAKVWRMRKVIIVPVLIGALGAVSVSFKEYMKQTGVKDGSYPENSIDSKDTKKSTVFVRRKKRETWNPCLLVVTRSLHGRNPTAVRHRCAQRFNSENEHIVDTAVVVTVLDNDVHISVTAMASDNAATAVTVNDTS